MTSIETDEITHADIVWKFGLHYKYNIIYLKNGGTVLFYGSNNFAYFYSNHILKITGKGIHILWVILNVAFVNKCAYDLNLKMYTIYTCTCALSIVT